MLNLNHIIGLVFIITLGQCVYIAKEQCPTNEEYLLCGSTCPTNCTNPNPDCSSDDCAEGCFCMAGYVRDGPNGTCISIDRCPGPNQCGDNEEFVPCATVCPATCRVPEPEVCGAACGMGCFCKDGFYRDEANNKCVTLDNCPAEGCFNANEVFDICSAACEPTCADPQPLCAALCKSGCVCADGFIRGPDGSCVGVDKCPANSTDTNVMKRYINAITTILHLPTA